MSEDEVEFRDDIDWQVDEDGTDFFVADGRRYELAEDGYAYDVGPAEPTGTSDVSTETPEESTPAVGAGDVEATRQMERVAPDEAAEAASEDEPTTVITAPAASTGGRTAAAPSSNGHGEPSGEPLLKVRDLHSGYGSLPVLHGVDLDIHVGQTAVLFGLNGAGKTTTAMNVCGALDVWSGSIEFDGVDVTKAGIKKCVDQGIVMVPEGRRVFPALTVAKNLQIGAWTQRKDQAWVDEQLETVLGYFPRLRERLQQDAGTLSGGEQQMLAMARGLMAKPRLLIIDEASMGLAPVIVTQVFEIVKQINGDGVTVLMIEQNVGALDVADVGIVMEQGTIIRRLRGEELTDRSVISEALMS
jgi:branched-chain amino acid transport system ATP-binding protein